MVDVDPSNYDVLLVGPRVGRLEPFFKQWGYRVSACHEGSAGLRVLRDKPFHLVVFELELEDLESHEFMAGATAAQPTSSFMLLEDPSKTGMIVSTFVQGADCYVPVPPDENRLYEIVGRQVLAAAARGGGAGDEVAQANAEVERARTALRDAGGKVRALTAENKELQEQIAALEKDKADLTRENSKLATDAKAAAGVGTAMLSLEGMPVSQDDLEEMASKADFVQFLESENDELKQAMKKMRERLRALGEDISDEDEDGTGEGDAIVSIEAGDDDEDDAELISFAEPRGAADALVALDLEDSDEGLPVEAPASAGPIGAATIDVDAIETGAIDMGAMDMGSIETGSIEVGIIDAAASDPEPGDAGADAVFDDADLFFDEDDDEPATSTIMAPGAATAMADDGQATALLSRDAALEAIAASNEAGFSEAGFAEAGFGEDGVAAARDEEGTLAGDALNASDLASSSEEGLNDEEEAELAALLAEAAAAEDDDDDDAFTGEMAATREISLGVEAPLDPRALLAQAEAKQGDAEPTHAVPGIGSSSSSSEAGPATVQMPRARPPRTLVQSDLPGGTGPSPMSDFSADDPTTTTPITPAMGKQARAAGKPSVKIGAIPGQDEATRLLDDEAVSMLRDQLGEVSLSDSLSIDQPDAVQQQVDHADVAFVEEPMADDEATAIGAEIPPELLAAYAGDRADPEPAEATHAGAPLPTPDGSLEDEMSALEEALLGGDEPEEATRVGAEHPAPLAPRVPSEMDGSEATRMNSLASLSAEELFGAMDDAADDDSGAFRDTGGSAPPPESDDFDDPTVTIAAMQGATAEPGTQIVDGIAGSSGRSPAHDSQPMAIEIDDDF